MAAPPRWTQAIAAVQGEHVEAISLTTPETDLASLQALGRVTSADDPAGVSAAFARVADLLTPVVEPTTVPTTARRRPPPRRPRRPRRPRPPRHDHDGAAHHGRSRRPHRCTRVRRLRPRPARQRRQSDSSPSLWLGCRWHLRRPVRRRAAAVPPAAGLQGPAGHPQAAQRVRHGQAHHVGRRGGPRAARQASRPRHRVVGRRHLRCSPASSSPWWRSSPSWPASSACCSADRSSPSLAATVVCLGGPVLRPPHEGQAPGGVRRPAARRAPAGHHGPAQRIRHHAGARVGGRGSGGARPQRVRPRARRVATRAVICPTPCAPWRSAWRARTSSGWCRPSTSTGRRAATCRRSSTR